MVYKMTGSGNDFVVLDGRLNPVEMWTPDLIRALCDRRSGLGADGLVVLEPGSRPGAVRFHFFNNDGGRAAMCGNASLCATRIASWLELVPPPGMLLETDAGTFETRCLPGPGELAEILLADVVPQTAPDIEPNRGERGIHLATVGVPHLVVPVDNVQEVDLPARGRELRFHPVLAPHGANVNFVSSSSDGWMMRTYERGVEAETLACGTGAVAAAAVLANTRQISLPWKVTTGSGRTLAVSGSVTPGGGLSQPRLVGEGRLVFRAVLGS